MEFSELTNLINTTSTLSLDDLPTADQLTQRARNTSAGQERLAKLEARRMTSSSRIYALIVSYADFLEQSFLSGVGEAIEDGLGFLCIDTAYLPNKRQDLTPDQTHWSGPDQDPSVGGVPKVMLLVGKRVPGSNVSDPTLLPGAKTSCHMLAERLNPKGYFVYCQYDRGAYRVYVVWDYEAWSDWQARSTAYYARRRTDQNTNL